MKQPAPTRIKITTNIEGKKTYTPQHKRWWLWYDFSNTDGGYNFFAHTNPSTYSRSENYAVIAQAQTDIENYIKAFNREESFRQRSVAISTEYVKFP